VIEYYVWILKIKKEKSPDTRVQNGNYAHMYIHEHVQHNQSCIMGIKYRLSVRMMEVKDRDDQNQLTINMYSSVLKGLFMRNVIFMSRGVIRHHETQLGLIITLVALYLWSCHTAPGLPDFSWNIIPKPEKMYQMYEMVIEHPQCP
jgi:hypothetical protein